MQEILREAIKIGVRKHEKGIPNTGVQGAESVFSQQRAHCRDVSTPMQQRTTRSDDLHCVGKRPGGGQGIIVRKCTIRAEALGAAADAQRTPNLVQICIAMFANMSWS